MRSLFSLKIEKKLSSAAFVISNYFPDKQKPTVDRCYSPLPVVSSEPYTHVTWEEPIFSDNSENDVFVRRSHAPGLFPMGKTTVTYIAYDQSGNNNTCDVIINVIREYKWN